MKIFITGGCKTGKSTLAQKLSVKMRPDGRPLYYIATMAPVDGEDQDRIKRHREERAGLGFHTVEMPRNIAAVLNVCDSAGMFLLDSVTALLANEMFAVGSVIPDAYIKVIRGMDKLLAAVDNIIVVSDYIFSDASIYDNITESYRLGLARLHTYLAKYSDAVVESCYGNFIIHKGPADFREVVNAVL